MEPFLGRRGRRRGVKCELVYAKMGHHGHGMVDLWTKPLEKWLKSNGWVKKDEQGSEKKGGDEKRLRYINSLLVGLAYTL